MAADRRPAPVESIFVQQSPLCVDGSAYMTKEVVCVLGRAPDFAKRKLGRLTRGRGHLSARAPCAQEPPVSLGRCLSESSTPPTPENLT